jgi:hypothetical protein
MRTERYQISCNEEEEEGRRSATAATIIRGSLCMYWTVLDGPVLWRIETGGYLLNVHSVMSSAMMNEERSPKPSPTK